MAFSASLRFGDANAAVVNKAHATVMCRRYRDAKRDAI
jgi:hypothetical protein